MASTGPEPLDRRRRAALAALALAAVAGGAGAAEDIVEVLRRSQRQRLARLEAADAAGADAARLRATFARLNAAASALGFAPVELLVVGGDAFAEAVFARPQVVASVALGRLGEGERTMILAHEIGHLHLHHWEALSGLYLRFIPGEVAPRTTDPVAAPLSAAAHRLSHAHELEADAFGYRLLAALGFGLDDAIRAVTHHGLQPDSATHPGTRKRMAHLRAMAHELEREAAALAPAVTLALARRPAGAGAGAFDPRD